MRVALSVVVRVVGGGVFLHQCLECLVAQAEGHAIEIIVPYDSTVSGIDQLKCEFPSVVFLDMGAVQIKCSLNASAAHELYDRRTAAGLHAARGEILALLEDYGMPDPDWCAQVLDAHWLPHGVIGGAVEHAGSGALNWAVYWMDFGRYQLPLREGPVQFLTDVCVSYKRSALESVKELWVERYNEVTVNWALARKGTILWQRPQIVVYQDRGQLSFLPLIAERFYWGRLFGRMRARELSLGVRLVYIIASPVIPLVMLWRVASKAMQGECHRIQFLTSFPYIIVMAVVWCLGELAGCVTS